MTNLTLEVIMTSLMDKVNEDIKTAMKAKEKDKLEALRFLKAKFIENNTAVKSINELDVVISHQKKLKDAISAYPEGHELRNKMIAEMNFIAPYLPQAMSEEEVVALIQQIKNAGAADFGGVMKELTGQIKGKFDGKRASELAKAAFTTN